MVTKHAALSGDRPPVRVLTDEACLICAAVGRPCGGVAGTCALIGCSACQGVTWIREEPDPDPDRDQIDFIQVCDEMHATSDPNMVFLWPVVNNFDEMVALTLPEVKRLRDWLSTTLERLEHSGDGNDRRIQKTESGPDTTQH